MKFLLSLVMTIGLALSSYSKSREVGENIDVLHYEIHLSEINIVGRTIDATTIITLKTLTSIDEIELELKSLDVTSVTSDDAIINNFSQNGDVLTVTFGNPVPANTTISLTVNYGGTAFRSEEESDTFINALDRAAENLERQIRKNKTRLEKTVKRGAFVIGEDDDDEYEEEGEFEGSAFNVAVESFYNMLYNTLTTGAPLEITPETAAKIIGIIEKAHAENPLPVKY